MSCQPTVVDRQRLPALASIMVGQHPLLRRALSDRSLTLLFIGLPDNPKLNKDGSAQLHGIVTTLSRSAHGWEPYRLVAWSQHARRKLAFWIGLLYCLVDHHSVTESLKNGPVLKKTHNRPKMGIRAHCFATRAGPFACAHGA